MRSVADVELDFIYEQRFWIVQRTGWVLFALALLAAGLGFTGHCPLAATQVESGAFSAEYDRFERLQSPFRLVFHAPVANGKLELSIDRAYLDRVQIEAITPEPEASEAAEDRVHFQFSAGSATEAVVTFDVQTDHFGSLEGVAEASGHGQVRLKQFIYP